MHHRAFEANGYAVTSQGIILGPENKQPAKITRSSLATNEAGYDEQWLQELLFANPELIPIGDIHDSSIGFVPLCRELAIPKVGGSIYLDIFGVTTSGKLVLIECKLWRNPQARREVVAQILEYASLLRTWSYGDLTSRIKQKLDSKSPNPLFEAAKRLDSTIEEAQFVDRVSRSLDTGDFILIIAGDGIRSDVHAIANHLNGMSGLTSQLALVEFQLWEAGDSGLIVIPALPFKTEVVKHRMIVDDAGRAISFEAEDTVGDDAEAVIDPKREQAKADNRAFWQSYIDQVRFDHPEQPQPRHGGQGWVKIPMPEPINWMTAFRTTAGDAGLFMRFRDSDGEQLFEQIKAAQSELDDQVGMASKLEVEAQYPFQATVSYDYIGDPKNEEAFLNWLLETSNNLVSVYRPFLVQSTGSD